MKTTRIMNKIIIYLISERRIAAVQLRQCKTLCSVSI